MTVYPMASDPALAKEIGNGVLTSTRDMSTYAARDLEIWVGGICKDQDRRIAGKANELT